MDSLTVLQSHPCLTCFFSNVSHVTVISSYLNRFNVNRNLCPAPAAQMSYLLFSCYSNVMLHIFPLLKCYPAYFLVTQMSCLFCE